ncbi:MAG: FecR domain-containing protein, partial [Chitinophagaceae bacterium]|nr:FecR domain-containing protein [Chitinophagaceae bacterium]
SDESRELEEWAAASSANRALLQRISDPDQLGADLSLLEESRSNIFARLQAGIPELEEEQMKQAPVVHRIHFLRRGFMKYAAAILLLIAVGSVIWITTNKKEEKTDQRTATSNTDILPGGNRASLTLADGSVILLDSTTNGTIAQQGNTSIEKLGNGQIRYNSVHGANTTMNNTMRTPRGGQFQLTLPDGTRVWLNAASSLTYPVAFTGVERKVTVTGEAYFEIARDARRPFLVDIDGKSLVHVLGTSFNVNAYDNEQSINTTLLDGSIQVKASTQTVLLKPGQQSMQTGGNITIDQHADTDRAIAWKNGKFDFNGLSLPAIMRQLERWYDIDVQFNGPPSKEVFKGRLTRDLTLSQVLDILGNMEVRYRLEGRTLILL